MGMLAEVDPARRRRPHAQEQLDERRLACARRSDDRRRPRRRRPENVRSWSTGSPRRYANDTSSKRRLPPRGSGSSPARRSVGPVAGLLVGEAVEERARLLDHLPRHLRLLAVRRRPNEDEHDGAERRDLPGAGCVEAGEAADEQQDHQALVEALREPVVNCWRTKWWRAPRCARRRAHARRSATPKVYVSSASRTDSPTLPAYAR